MKKTQPTVDDTPKIEGFKGYDKNLKCRDMQYEIGKDYQTERAKACETGFHFCENPLDVFGYYSPSDSRYTTVTGSGKTDTHEEDTKVACNHIHVGAEITLEAMVKGAVKFVFDKVDWSTKKESNTGDSSAATNTGDSSAATNTGDSSAATNTGDRSAAIVEGKESVAMSIGIEGKARGKIGCWIVCAEWKLVKNEWHRTDIKCALVDGIEIKEDTFYVLTNGKFTETE